MTEYDPNMMPQLRRVIARPLEQDGRLLYALSDPTGLAEAVITVGEPGFFVMSKFDGLQTLESVRESFQEFFRTPLEQEALAEMIDGLKKARFLAGEEFEQYYTALVEEYRAAPTRVMRSAAELGLEEKPREVIEGIIHARPASEVSGRIVGLIAPHLDYPRGAPCYSAAYSTLVNHPRPDRVVILGTNHFGQSTSVVTTVKDFETPLGITPTDSEFIERLEAGCGPLREHELDHQREHSIELQLLFCQYLWGADSFRIVPVLCPDPCGPTGTEPIDGQGVDLKDFNKTLAQVIEDDPEETLIIAGADFSHVGAFFGEDRELDEDSLAEVKKRDSKLLDLLETNDAEAFRREVAADDNPTSVCSAGCVYTTMSVLDSARVTVLGYHQAVDQNAQNGVTCAAAVFAI